MDELWDIARVARYLGVSERTVYNRVRSGELSAVKVGRLWRVRPSELEAWLATRNTSATLPGSDVPGPYPVDALPLAAERVAETPPLPTRGDLEDLLAPLGDILERRLAFVGLLTRGVELLGWPPPVIVGGSAVQFYTAAAYPTADIDVVGASEPIAEVLHAWGFTQAGRHWYDEELELVLEAPGARLEPDEARHVIQVRFLGVGAYVLGIEDLLIDRLNACVHWDDAESCMWARTMFARHRAGLDMDYLAARASAEDVAEQLCALLAEEPNS